MQTHLEDEQFAARRRRMVAEQLQARGITDTAVLTAMNTIPRERFVLPAYQEMAYDDAPLPIPEGQTISQPYIVAYMLMTLELKPTDRVLEIGTGSGYQTAVLSQIVREVYTVERHEALVRYARERLQQLGCDNVQLCHGDGSVGWPQHGPYDAIIVSAGGPVAPLSLEQQLAVNGRLVIPIGQDKHEQMLVRYRKDSSGEVTGENLGAVKFVPLIGSEGWHEEECHSEELAHTAEVGLRLRAGSSEAIFGCAARAMFTMLGALADDENLITPRFVAVESMDAESLLVDWLNELLYQHEINGEIYPHCRITSWEPTRLEAILHGYKMAAPPIMHIKAVTYHQLQLTKEEEGWTAVIFFDI